MWWQWQNLCKTLEKHVASMKCIEVNSTSKVNQQSSLIWGCRLTESCHVAQAGLHLFILLPQPLWHLKWLQVCTVQPESNPVLSSYNRMMFFYTGAWRHAFCHLITNSSSMFISNIIYPKAFLKANIKRTHRILAYVSFWLINPRNSSETNHWKVSRPLPEVPV